MSDLPIAGVPVLHMTVGLAFWQLPRFVLLAYAHRLWLVLVVFGLLGILCGAINPILSSVMYERIPEVLRGRVLGAGSAGCYAAIPVGAALAGWLVELVGLRDSLLAGGAAYLLVTLSPVVLRVWGEMDDRRGAAADPG